MKNKLRWSSAFFEVFETASGWWWYLRLRDHRAIAQASRHYESIEALRADIEHIPLNVVAALATQPLIAKSIGEECDEDGLGDSPKKTGGSNERV